MCYPFAEIHELCILTASSLVAGGQAAAKMVELKDLCTYGNYHLKQDLIIESERFIVACVFISAEIDNHVLAFPRP